MTDESKRLEQLERALLDPASRSDAILLDRLIADDFMEVAASGRAFGKDEVLARLPSETGISFQVEDLAVCLLAPTIGLVTYAVIRTADAKAVRSRRCSIWRLEQTQWRMVYHQGTAV
jgi:hypothetical protein